MMYARSSSPLVFLLVSSLTLWLSAGCGDADADLLTDEMHLISDQGLFEAHLVPAPDPPVTGANELQIHLVDRDGRAVSGAQIDLEPWMPAHGHGSTEAPVIVEEGGGAYTATNLVFQMPGHWEVSIDVRAGQDDDRLVAYFDVQ